MTRITLLAVGLTLLAPAAASAQDPPPVPPPAPAPPPPPTITMEAKRVLGAGKDAIVLRKRPFRVQGTLMPVVAGQQVELWRYVDGKRRQTVRVPVAPDGTFALRMPARHQGRVSVRAFHAATPELGEATGPKVSVQVVEPRASAGASGALVRLLQRGLHRLRYAVPRNGRFDDATGRAVMAFRKVNGMARSYDANRAVIKRVLAGKGAFKPRHPDAGRHVEADISRQVLALIDHGKVVATYHTSSGAPGTPTVIGSFRVYLKTPGYNAKGMLDSNYFIRGYAIHGYVDVPAFNASHGCLRVPLADAARIFAWLHLGDRVVVYP